MSKKLLFCIGIIVLATLNTAQNKTSTRFIQVTQLSNPILPPDPGEAGTETLEGIDSDGDGLRDDVQIFLFETYPSQHGVREILIARAKIIQDMLLKLEEEDAEAVVALIGMNLDTQSCLRNYFYKEFTEDEDYFEHLKAFDIEVTNTFDRYLLYLDRGRFVHGMSLNSLQSSEPCSLVNFTFPTSSPMLSEPLAGLQPLERDEEHTLSQSYTSSR